MRNRKMEDDEMLVTHTPAPAKDMSGGEGTEDVVDESLDPAILTARLAAITDPTERAELVREIQARLGNRAAERIIRAAGVAEVG